MSPEKNVIEKKHYSPVFGRKTLLVAVTGKKIVLEPTYTYI